jgi:hypothetical protein
MKLNEESILQALDSIYDNVILGLPGSDTVYELADKYLQVHHHEKFAAEALVRWQTAKCAGFGFVSGLGGVMSFPLTIPADLAANYYIQMRMVAAIALINGYDIKSEQVKSFIYCCLLGQEVDQALRKAGLKMGRQWTKKAITSMSQDFVAKVNSVVRSRLVAKVGRSGIAQLSKALPLAGGFFGAGFNGFVCYEIGKSAQQLFPKAEDDYSMAA